MGIDHHRIPRSKTCARGDALDGPSNRAVDQLSLQSGTNTMELAHLIHGIIRDSHDNIDRGVGGYMNCCICLPAVGVISKEDRDRRL